MRTTSLLLLAAAALAGSETPPAGPPWQRVLLDAQKEALEEGRPLFVYFTKTYWPHCVVVEEQLLPSPALKPAYGKAVWVYVYRDFSGSEEDRLAERISIRFGVTSWPQLLLADPASLEILEHTGRAQETFLRAVDAAAGRVTAARSLDAWERLKAAEARARALEKGASVKRAREGIDDADIVVRTRALAVLAKKDPRAIVARAEELLGVPSDPFRYEVCRVLKEAKARGAARALEKLVKDPSPSLNPNVVRIRAVEALAACGDARSIDVVAPFAQSGEFYNGLTGVSVDTLKALAAHDRDRARDALRRAYPPPADPADARAVRACTALARRVFDALGEKGSFPDPYDAKARERLMR